MADVVWDRAIGGSGFPPLYGWSGGLRESRPHLACFVVLLVVVWLSTKLIWQTMRAYRIRSAQVLRVAVWAWVGMVAWHAAGALLVTSVAARLHATRGQLLPAWPWILTEILPLLSFAVSLTLGMTAYLRLRRGYLDAALIVLFTLLATALGIGVASVYGYGSLHSPLASTLHSTWPHFAMWFDDALKWLLA